jgi:tryptophanyl-tRNA synthetase
MVVASKIYAMSTNGQRVRQTDAGDPDLCPVGDLHKAFSRAEVIASTTHGCRTATMRCEFCKIEAAKSVCDVTGPIHQRRRRLESDIDGTWEMLRAQSRKAQERAEQTMVPVRTVLDLSHDLGAVRRHFGTSADERRRSHDLSQNSSWWVLPSDQQSKLVRDYWRNNLLPYDVPLSQEANRIFPSLERELEEPFLTSKKKRVLVATSTEEPSGWHFRIPARSYEVWVLLCWHSDYHLDAFAIPQKYFSQEFAQAKKRSNQETIHVRVWKFSDKWTLEFVDLIAAESSGQAMSVPARDPIEITDLLGNYDPLK